MPALRAALDERGVPGVRTLLASGNLVVDWPADDVDTLVALTRTTIARDFGLEIPVVARTAVELDEVARTNPFPDQALTMPKLLQVTFMERAPDTAAITVASGLVAGDELLEVRGREAYSWHPDGVARSRLAAALVNSRMPTATARNWATVQKILTMCADVD